MLLPMGPAHPPKATAHSLVRYDQLFLVAELIFIGLLVANLLTSSASHAAAAELIMSGPYALPFWGVVVGLGVVVPLLWQGAELAHKVPHTVLPAILVLVGGYTLRWVMVNAGQMSTIVPTALLSP